MRNDLLDGKLPGACLSNSAMMQSVELACKTGTPEISTRASRPFFPPGNPGARTPANRSLNRRALREAPCDHCLPLHVAAGQAIGSKKGALGPALPVRCSSGDRDGMRKAAGWLDISKQNRWPQASLQHCWSKGDARTVSCRKSNCFFVSQLCAPAFLAEVSC